ncbi:MAG: AraC family transcriptional regulator [Bacteroidetes bacterium]|nr:MAG: AraC family transcriptional regulator [Bacteroidota bacterium]
MYMARELMDDCYAEELDIERLSREACISPYHFIRLFKQTFNTTPHRYLVNRRIERAKTLLASSDKSVTDVCFDVGFQSVGSFSSLFTKMMGSSPMSYRVRVYEALQLPLWSVPANIPCCFLIKSKLQQIGL